MQALQITGYGAISECLSLREVPKPEVLDDEVLLEIHAASLNPHNYKTVRGEFRRIEKIAFPSPIGTDASGVVVAKGKNVTEFNIGDEVFGIVAGAISSYGTAKSTQVITKPKSISHYEAASLPLVGLTTIQAFEWAKIAAGDRVLIHAGSGGIGTFAIQYAKTIGAYVYSTTSTQNIRFIKNLGADVAIDYRREDYLDLVKDVDVVYDTLGAQYTFDAFRVIRQGGRIISLLPAELTREVAVELGLPSLTKIIFSLKPSKIARLKKAKNAQYKFIYVDVDRRGDLIKISNLVTAGSITPIIDAIFAFNDSISAFKYLSAGHAKGKVVIKIR